MNRLILCFFYFMTLALIGIELAYLPLYAKHLGASTFQISLLVASSFIVNSIFIVPWAFFADKVKTLKPLVVLGLFASLIATLFFPFVKNIHYFIAIFYLFTSLQVVIYPQVETLTIHTGHREGFHYGTVRAVGSMGFVITAFLFGYLIDWRGIVIVPVLYIAVTSLQFLSSARFPKDKPEETIHATFKELANIIFRKKIVLFIISCVLVQISHGVYFGFFSIWLSQNGYSSVLIGILWAITISAEVISLWKGRYLIDKWGTNRLYSFSLAACGFRWLVYYLSPLLSVILVGQLLNAFSYGTFHLAAMNFITKNFPRHIRQTGIAIYTASSFGVGAAIGTLSAGLLVPKFGISPLFLWSAIIAWFSAIVSLPILLEKQTSIQ